MTQTSSGKFHSAADAALCNLLASGAGSAAAAFTWSLVAPGTPVNAIAGVAAGVASLAYAYGCETDMDKPNPYPGSHIDGCREASEGAYVENSPGIEGNLWSPLPWGNGVYGWAWGYKIQSIRAVNPSDQGTVEYITDVVEDKATGKIRTSNIRMHKGKVFRLAAAEGTCEDTDQPEDPDIPDYTYTSDDDCEINVHFLGFAADKNNNLYPAWEMSPSGSSVRAGGIIGGCNFEPTIIVQNPRPPGGDQPPDGPPNPPGPPGLPPIPRPPTDSPIPDGEPWWMPLARNAIGGVVAGITEELIESIITERVAAGGWYMNAYCNFDPEGNRESITTEFPESSFQTAVLNRLDAIPEYLGQHLAWKTPTCDERPAREGDWITIEFMSDEISPMGTRRLRKLFRYRSKSSRELGDLIDYWKDFVWSAGPVCVKHTGAWWGSPQSWASTAGEGKRLIQYAAAEAGLDPDQVGQWEVSGSNNPRYGMSGTMRVRINKGTYCITNRLGPSGLPIVGKVSTDPRVGDRQRK